MGGLGEVWARWGHVLVASALAVPLLAAVTAARARHLGWRAAVAEVAAVVGPLPWLWMILTPLPRATEIHPIPFQELPGYVHGAPVAVIVQVVGNLAVFAAFGAGAPVRWRIRLSTVALLACAGSVTVEVLQYVFDLGRVASVDDVLLNTAGAALAALATRRWWRRRRAGRRDRLDHGAEA